MNKFLFTPLLLGGLPAAVFAEPILYGKANISYQAVNEGDESSTELKSNASRIGVKGVHALESGLEAIYKAEFEVQIDDGDKDGDVFSQRNIYVGLKGGFGTIKGGKFDTPLKTAQKKVDLFNDLEGDIKNLITDHDNRVSNIVDYQTPKFGPFVGKVALISSEEDGVDDAVSAAVAFEQQGWYFSAAIDQNVEAQDTDVLRVVGQYKVAGFQFGLLYETVDQGDGTEDQNAGLASLQYTYESLAFKAQYGQSDEIELEAESLSLGIDYNIDKQLTLFTFYTQLESEAGTEDDYFGLGLEVKF